ncbi:MAG: HAD-IC family P-type ATPase [Candidatus ainarchaeum sp.]|nr:HAD-IC family P-type ATPase [Candidatus ainarchaeum sp.]
MKAKKNKIERAEILYHSFDIEKTFSLTNSSLEGLPAEEAERRLSVSGKNELPQKRKKSIIKIILRELINPIIILLLFATAFSILVGDWLDASVILLLIMIDIVMGTVQEKRAERIANSLMNMIKTDVKVLRDGEKFLIDAKNLVVGDIVFLESGDKVSADMRIITCSNLKVDESILTGESLEAEKNTEIYEEQKALAERKNMLFAGSSVMTGRAMAVVVEIGIHTQIGNIADKLNKVKDEQSPLAVRIKKFSKQITFGIAFVAVVIFILLILQGEEVNTILLFVVALAVSAIPEGLPLAVTIALSVASNKMVKKNVVVKNLNAVESLGSCTVIASDKTGTLTLNEQTAKLIVLPNNDIFEVSGSGYNDEGEIIPKKNTSIELANEIIFNGLINNEAKLYKRNQKFRSLGDSIDIAFLALAMKAKILKNKTDTIFTLPYESEKKYSAVFYKQKRKTICTVKGSIEKILSFCKTMKVGESIEKVNVAKINKQHEKYASKGYRLIAIASGEYSGKPSEEGISNLTFLGFVCFIDPVRLESKPAVENCHNAGIKVLMITGDHPLTAFAIAKEIGIANETEQITTGAEVEKYFALGQKQFDLFIKTKTVFSRVTPTDKLNIVNSLKHSGEFVAVTGDGVNDAPAIKTAHIGIAMGSGTDVSKETADMIITDDNFNSIVQGISEGRTAFSNIRKVTYLLLSEGIAEILFFLISVLCGLPIPLIAIQILYLNIITNGLQDFALAFERAENGIMQESPRSTKESLFSKSLLIESLISGLVIGLLVLGVWIYLIKFTTVDLYYARSVVMALMVFLQNFHTFNCRSETKSIFKIDFWSNKLIFFSVASAVIFQIMLMEIPFLANLLQLTSVAVPDLLIMLSLSILIMIVMELYKLTVRNYRKKHHITRAY